MIKRLPFLRKQGQSLELLTTEPLSKMRRPFGFISLIFGHQAQPLASRLMNCSSSLASGEVAWMRSTPALMRDPSLPLIMANFDSSDLSLNFQVCSLLSSLTIFAFSKQSPPRDIKGCEWFSNDHMFLWLVASLTQVEEEWLDGNFPVLRSNIKQYYAKQKIICLQEFKIEGQHLQSLKQQILTHCEMKTLDRRACLGDQLCAYLAQFVKHPNKVCLSSPKITGAKGAVARTFAFFMSQQKPLQQPDALQVNCSLNQLWSNSESFALIDFSEKLLVDEIDEYKRTKSALAQQRVGKEFDKNLARLREKMGVFRGWADFPATVRNLVCEADEWCKSLEAQKKLRVLVQEALLGKIEKLVEEINKLQNSQKTQKFSEQTQKVKTSRTQVSKEQTRYLKIISQLQSEVMELSKENQEIKRQMSRAPKEAPKQLPSMKSIDQAGYLRRQLEESRVRKQQEDKQSQCEKRKLLLKVNVLEKALAECERSFQSAKTELLQQREAWLKQFQIQKNQMQSLLQLQQAKSKDLLSKSNQQQQQLEVLRMRLAQAADSARRAAESFSQFQLSWKKQLQHQKKCAQILKAELDQQKTRLAEVQKELARRAQLHSVQVEELAVKLREMEQEANMRDQISAQRIGFFEARLEQSERVRQDLQILSDGFQLTLQLEAERYQQKALQLQAQLNYQKELSQQVQFKSELLETELRSTVAQLEQAREEQQRQNQLLVKRISLKQSELKRLQAMLCKNQQQVQEFAEVKLVQEAPLQFDNKLLELKSLFEEEKREFIARKELQTAAFLATQLQGYDHQKKALQRQLRRKEQDLNGLKERTQAQEVQLRELRREESASKQLRKEVDRLGELLRQRSSQHTEELKLLHAEKTELQLRQGQTHQLFISEQRAVQLWRVESQRLEKRLKENSEAALHLKAEVELFRQQIRQLSEEKTEQEDKVKRLGQENQALARKVNVLEAGWRQKLKQEKLEQELVWSKRLEESNTLIKEVESRYQKVVAVCQSAMKQQEEELAGLRRERQLKSACRHDCERKVLFATQELREREFQLCRERARQGNRNV